jgi:hypothetical protein
MYTGPGTTARYAGTCTRCGQPYTAGDIIMRWKNSALSNASWAHHTCPPPTREPTSSPDGSDSACVGCSLPDWDPTTISYMTLPPGRGAASGYDAGALPC